MEHQYMRPIIKQDKIQTHGGMQLKRYSQKMIAVEKELIKINYDVKLYELTQSYAFAFDIYKVMNGGKKSIISKMCFSFYYFLALKMLFFYYLSARPTNKPNIKPSIHTSHHQNLNNLKKRVTTLNNVPFSPNHKLNKNQNANEQLTEKQADFGYCFLLNKLMKANENLKEAYFQLNESFKNRDRVAKLQIVSFLITLISPQILHPIVENIQLQFGQQVQKKDEENVKVRDCNSKFDIEEQIFIVLTYQTLGSLVSQNVFSCLKKKYIKQTIFHQNGDLSYVRLIKSLKFIKQKLSSQKNVLIKGRKQREKENSKIRRHVIDSTKCIQKSMTKEDMKDFIRSALKQRDLDLNQYVKPTQKQNQLDHLNNKLKQSFYPSISSTEKKLFTKISLPSQSPAKKNSVSVKTKLDLENYRSSKEKQIKKKKFLASNVEIFYKFKKVQKKPESLKIIKTCRTSLKANNLKLSNHQQPVSNFENQNFIQIKTKLSLFKEQALKDLRSIEEFKPNQIQISKTKANLSRTSFQNELSSHCSLTGQNWKQYKAASEQRFSAWQSQLEKKKFKINLLNKEKQEVWHEMFSLKNEVKGSEVEKKLSSSPKFDTKISRTSDNLRKFQKQFVESCQRRASVMLEDRIKYRL